MFRPRRDDTIRSGRSNGSLKGRSLFSPFHQDILLYTVMVIPGNLENGCFWLLLMIFFFSQGKRNVLATLLTAAPIDAFPINKKEVSGKNKKKEFVSLPPHLCRLYRYRLMAPWHDVIFTWSQKRRCGK